MLTFIDERGAFLVPPCPPWCALRPDHDVDDPFSQDAGGLLRHHGRDWPLPGHRDAVSVGVAWTEGIGYRPGADPHDPPGLYLYADDCGSTLTPAQARAIARLLELAADFFEAEVQ